MTENPKKLSIFITGGAGFIGSALIRYLIKFSNHNIINIDKLTYAGNLASLKELEANDRYVFEQVDICDHEKVKTLFQSYKPDCIMHLAAETHVDRSIDGSSEFIRTNIMGTHVLLESSRDYWNGLGADKKDRFRFHHVSTDEVYGDLTKDDPAFNETHSYNPSSPYSASKASSDHLVRAWGRTYKLPILISNCSNNYGPYHYPEKFIPHMILNALAGKQLPVYGDGLQIRDWLYVDDHAKALYTVLTRGKIGETYNVGGNNEKTNLEVVRLVCRYLDDLAAHLRPAHINTYADLIEFVDDRPGHDRRYAINNNKITSELNWAPDESFETGLLKTVQWYLQHEEWWQSILGESYALARIGKI